MCQLNVSLINLWFKASIHYNGEILSNVPVPIVLLILGGSPCMWLLWPPWGVTINGRTFWEHTGIKFKDAIIITDQGRDTVWKLVTKSLKCVISPFNHKESFV